MSLHRIVLIVALVFALAAPSAHAFFDPPWITPAMPRAGEMLSVNIRDGICDAIFEHPGFPQITQQGNAIRLVEYGHHWETADLCIYDIGHLVEPIGAFPPGDYTVTVDFIYDNYPFGLTTITIGAVSFTVAGVKPGTPVPTSTASGRLALLVLVSGSALWALRTYGEANETDQAAQYAARVQHPEAPGEC